MTNNLIKAQKRSFASDLVTNIAGFIPTTTPFKKQGSTTVISFTFFNQATPLKVDDYFFSGRDVFQTAAWNETRGPTSSTFTTMNGDVVQLNGLKGEKAMTYIALSMWAAVADIQLNKKDNINLVSRTFNGKQYKDVTAEDEYTFKFAVADKANFFTYNENAENTGHGHGWYDDRGVSLSPPTSTEMDAGWGVFNNGVSEWNEKGPLIGTGGFKALIHEIGHMFGLLHPEDASPGEGQSYVTNGAWSKDVGIYASVMTQSGYGLPEVPWAGLGAVDIAAIQSVYGKNNQYRTGNDAYVLPTARPASSVNDNLGYMCLWDADGVDEIRIGTGAYTRAVIDLRAATLKTEEGGGGWLSSVDGVQAGFTIANGVKIENATGGGGNDSLRGNEFANRLDAGDGADTLFGGDGADTLVGGAGADLFVFRNLRNLPGGGATVGGVERIQDFVTGTDKLDFRQFDRDITSQTFDPADWTFNASGSASPNKGAQLYFNVATKYLYGDCDGNGVADFSIYMPSTSNVTSDDLILKDRSLSGGSGADVLAGGTGDDTFYGGAGADTLTGGYGADVFTFKAQNESTNSMCDTIRDFRPGADKLDLRRFMTSSQKEIDAFLFVGAGPFVANGVAQLRFDGNLSKLYGDVNGDGSTDFALNMTGVKSLGTADFTSCVVSQGDDLFTGSDAPETISGSAGSDSLSGEGGSDYLAGDIGSDRLVGGAGNDTLYGGDGADVMKGGDGADVFVFRSITDFRDSSGARVFDQILDFANEDRLDFRNFVTTSFDFVGSVSRSAHFTKAGRPELLYNDAEMKLWGDVNGDGSADFTLLMPDNANGLFRENLILA